MITSGAMASRAKQVSMMSRLPTWPPVDKVTGIGEIIT
jgi:hypothetical protein